MTDRTSAPLEGRPAGARAELASGGVGGPFIHLVAGSFLAQRLEHAAAQPVPVVLLQAEEPDAHEPPGAAGLLAHHLGLGLHAAVLELEDQVHLRAGLGRHPPAVDERAHPVLAHVDGLADQLGAALVARLDRHRDAGPHGPAALAVLGLAGDRQAPADDAALLDVGDRGGERAPFLAVAQKTSTASPGLATTDST